MGIGDANRGWEDMYGQLVAFRKKNGHCGVHTNWKENPALGRWVATQRHRRRLGRLTQEQIGRLDKICFTWAPCDESWDNMYRALIEFRKKHGHCEVPSHWPANVNLASWVANQRHRRKMSRLSTDRVRKLDRIGFTWAIYRAERDRVDTVRRARPERAKREASVRQVEPPLEQERLYNVGSAGYVQYDGHDKLPRELERYAQTHRGELPPYIPLPSQPIRFVIGESYARKPRKVAWRGRGRLPREVLEFVNENGVLPPHN